MKEAGNIKHPPFNFVTHPDLGGTNYDFARGVSRDKIVYEVRNPFCLTNLEIPGDKSFLHVSVDTLEGGRFLDAYYSFLGELTSANLWFSKYCDQQNFVERAKPSKKISETYNQLFDREADIMVEVEMGTNQLGLYFCQEDSTASNIKVITSAAFDITRGGLLLNFHPDEEGQITPVTFFAENDDKDEVLSLGFCVDDLYMVSDNISTIINIDKIFGNPTPKTVRDLIDAIFVKS